MSATSGEPSACERVLSLTELLDSVVHCLEGDNEALMASSLVCRSWSLSAAREIFKHLEIRSRDQSVKNRSIDIPDEPRWFALRSCPRVVYNVRELTMVEDTFLEGERYTPTDVLHRTLAMFPRLHTLRMHYMSATASPADGPFQMPPNFLRKFAFVEVKATGSDFGRYPVPLPQILGLFTHLDNLAYWHGQDDLRGDPSEVSQAVHGHTRVHVEQLTLNWLANGRGIWRLAEAIEVSKLRKMHLQIYSTLDECPALCINALLSQRSLPLQDIHIELSQYAMESLRSLLRFADPEANERIRRGLMFTLTSTPLRSICITIALWIDFCQLFTLQNTLVWEPLIDSIASTPASLSRATLVIRCLPYFHDLEDLDIASAVHALNWSCVEGLLGTRPHLHTFEIRFDLTALMPESSQKFNEEIMAGIPNELAKFVRFCTI